MKAIIVDDEPRAIELIQSYLANFESIQVVGTFRNALKALEFLRQETVDLIFLDINMPHLSGLSMAKLIRPGSEVIFTTAYSEFAVESYEVEAIDYLLKPISFERFTRAINKVLSGTKTPIMDDQVLLIKSGATVHRLSPGEILYLEKDGNYLNYCLKGRKIMARESVAEALEKLTKNFLQCHKSYIVNIGKIESYNKEEISIDSKIIPIGSTFKQGILNKLS